MVHLGVQFGVLPVIRLVNTFIEDVTLKLLGNSEMVDMSSISAGAYINYKLNTEVQNNLRLVVTSVQEESDPVDNETDEDEDNNNNQNSKGP
ncbi:hypothetical protein TNCV_3999471 [Trichonephila clavipes]|nr:hypothetical protein TNCV_3999471 [Trichonephila clavipes]